MVPHKGLRCHLDLPPKWDKWLRDKIHGMEKMNHGIVSQAVYSGVQVGRDPAAGARYFDNRSSTGIRSESERAASLVEGVSPGSGECLSGTRATALVGRTRC